MMCEKARECVCLYWKIHDRLKKNFYFRLYASMGLYWADGLLLEEGISLLQESYKRPDCTVILTGCVLLLTDLSVCLTDS